MQRQVTNTLCTVVSQAWQILISKTLIKVNKVEQFGNFSCAILQESQQLSAFSAQKPD